MANIGRPTKWSEEVEQAALDYIENYADVGDAIPSIMGMAGEINIAETTLYRWAEENKGNFRDILATCNERQKRVLINKGLTNEFNSNITKLALGKHGYHDKADTTLSGPNGGAVKIENQWALEPCRPVEQNQSPDS